MNDAHPNGLVPARQSRMANIKVATSVMKPEAVVDAILAISPDAAILYAVHNEPGHVEHAHYVARFPSTVRWTSLAQTLHDLDGHEYAAPAKSWRRSARYLLHLDNPEKPRVLREALRVHNVDSTEVSQLMGAAKLPILESLSFAESLPLSERFSFLVCERGHQPSEVSAALRCMMDLERWTDTRTARQMHRIGSALPSPDQLSKGEVSTDYDSEPFFDEEEEGGPLLDEDGNPIPDDA